VVGAAGTVQARAPLARHGVRGKAKTTTFQTL